MPRSSSASPQSRLAPAGSTPVETIADLHSKLGNACMVRGDLESAAANYKAALRLVPGLTSCWCNLGNIHVQTGKPQDAIAYYLEALKLNPRHWATRTNLVQALMATKQYIIAKALLLELLGERPQDAALHHQLGKVHYELEEVPDAIACFEQAIALNPRDADSLYWIGGIKQRLGRRRGGPGRLCRRRREIQPLIRRPAIKSPADFRVLALYAPFGGNTPTEYLFKNADYDTDTLAMFENNSYDAEAFRQGVDVVVNLISDVDQAGAMLPLAADLVERLGKPIINDPRKIQRTTRDMVAELLTGIEGCRIPKISAPAGRHRAFGRKPARRLAASRLDPGPAGRNPWRRRFRQDRRRGRTRGLSGKARRDRPLFHRICRLSLGRRLLPEISLHLRRRRGAALSSRDLRRLEGAPRQHRHGQPEMDAGRGSRVPERSDAGLQ